ncbi:transcriptional regulator [Paenibacillus sp. J31TS4]|uniref:LysR family transcriptional regulator n=1 Tax=Paenibacillus sp. J31TS4 TaxID=2807195 RepID=UPI001B0626A2|nr:LysR family transcriptional regulator [Paenibacillus sp. J31TS4]GIP40503.1 transcriptional regulator [Paenibacillus sp. J31TS4]
MHLEQLECIVEVAKTGSLTGAASNLNITLSAVSQSISGLESELGVVLFTRSRQGSTPTVEGRRIIRRAIEVVSKLQELRDEAAAVTNTQSGEIRLASIPGPLSVVLESLMAFKHDYPNIRIEILEDGTQEILEGIRHNRIDLGLTVLTEEQADRLEGLIFGKLMEVRLVVAVNRQSPLRFHHTVAPEELAALPLVLYKDESVSAYLKQLEEKAGPMNVLFSTNHTETIRRAVLEGLAATVGLDFSFRGAGSDLVTLPLAAPGPIPPRYLGWLRSADKHFSNASRLLIDKVRYELETMQPT